MTDLDGIRREALPLDRPEDLDPLLDRIGEARFVLIGEASHGTHDFYAWRDALTRRLIAEKGFGLVAVEGDWPDCERVNRAVTGDADPFQALYAFMRWPAFMWANEEVALFCRWLRSWNAGRPPGARCGFHGLDVYSLRDSLRAVRRYAAAHLPAELDAVMDALHCFESFGHDPQRYAAAAVRLVPESCEEEVVGLLSAVLRAAPRDLAVRQNAEVVAGAERYYRAMVRGGPDAWNVRLAGERHGGDAVLVGFGGHRGSVVAGDRWGGRHHVMPVPPARPGSLEALLHEALPDRPRALFVVPDGPRPGWYDERLDHRAIGVVYRPDRERWDNYVPTETGRRYDAFLWLDRTTALHPLHGEPWGDTEPETYPSAV
ncbi:erythromycin esterase family protein [Actinomadura sp. ATCC 31491]|uniref:Erythromycin esterase family protein n=1 Tax=Actinomadura luzonensis TaxID=2805427 RepID=A0ABT0G348_9ACTN|nr:erythromycin esterase family protein [Actinomadura luzonensis]MCK2219019.1 erythromycin esterase family protein [Actinomadura luzonensis]